MIEKLTHTHNINTFDSLYARDNRWLKLGAKLVQMMHIERVYVVAQFENVVAYYRLKLDTMANSPIVMAHFAVSKDQEREARLEEMLLHAINNFEKVQELVAIRALVAHIKHEDLALFKKHDFIVLTKCETHVEVMRKN